jgi:nucleotide-binding universal stress UspA family protein
MRMPRSSAGRSGWPRLAAKRPNWFCCTSSTRRSPVADRESGADERYLSELVAALKDRGFKSRPVLLHGPNPAAEIVNYLRKDPVDLLVVGSHGHGMVRDLLLGQTVDRVRHRLGVPMLIARPDRAVAPESAVDDGEGPVSAQPSAPGKGANP